MTETFPFDPTAIIPDFLVLKRALEIHSETFAPVCFADLPAAVVTPDSGVGYPEKNHTTQSKWRAEQS